MHVLQQKEVSKLPLVERIPVMNMYRLMHFKVALMVFKPLPESPTGRYGDHIQQYQ